MSLAALLIPPSLDAKQAFRLHRLGVAALTYVLTAAFVAIAWLFDVLPGRASLEILVAYLAINAGLYLAIRSGFNLRFKDPSLTSFQILAGITVVMYIVYSMDDSREIGLFGCFLVFLFGIFRLRPREFTGITLYTLAVYGLVINLLMHFRPRAIHDLRLELLSWLMLAGFLPCFIIIGGQFNALRSKLRESEARSRESAQKLRLFADNIPAMTASWDENLICRFANAVFAEFFEVKDIVGKHLRDIAGAEVYREVEGHFAQALRGYPVTYQRIRKLRSGEPRHLEIRLVPHVGDQGNVLGCFSVTTDITAHKLAEERIQRVAHHDSLTGLPNRLLFNDRLGQAIMHAKRNRLRFALLYLDLDRFKPVNDILGHAAGDELLKEVAARIGRQVRESDTVARVGGDEFVVILLDIAERVQAQTVARKIVAAFAAPFHLDSAKQDVEIGTSIGIAMYPADALDADALVKAADAAMYGAKQAGNYLQLYAA